MLSKLLLLKQSVGGKGIFKMNQYSRREATCDYCGKVQNRHNLKVHTDTPQKGKLVKERLKRQSAVTDFLLGGGSKKAKETEPTVTLEEELNTVDQDDNERDEIETTFGLKPGWLAGPSAQLKLAGKIKCGWYPDTTDTMIIQPCFSPAHHKLRIQILIRNGTEEPIRKYLKCI